MPTKAQTEQREKALKPFKKGQRTSEEQERIAKLGGIKSGEVRREKKLFKEEILKRLNEDDWDEMILNLIKRAKGNDNSLEVLRDTIGQKPLTEIKADIEADVFIDAKMK